MEEIRIVHEVPSSLKQLARFIAQGFHTPEDKLIIDMLVRNPCMKEDDLCELLKFERKQLRAKIAGLKNDKFIQPRLRMETGLDGKAQRVNYYFINYKSLVNIVKYKLDMMRKRMESEERQSASRTIFKCDKCCKTYTDLQADQLFNAETNQFHCLFCNDPIEEDDTTVKPDSRSMIANFNSLFQPVYNILQEVDGVRLGPSVLEPEPTDLSSILGRTDGSGAKKPENAWSGEATRHRDTEQMDVTIGADETVEKEMKERPIWLMESTVIDRESNETNRSSTMDTMETDSKSAAASSAARTSEDIMQVLLQHEKRTDSVASAPGSGNGRAEEDSSDSSGEEPDKMGIPDFLGEEEAVTQEDDEEDEEDVPFVVVGGKKFTVTDVNDEVIAKMTPDEKSHYIQVYQEYYASMYE